MMTNISEHISYFEATQSNTATRKGIDNTPFNETVLERMRTVANECFEPARAHFGPIRINSFYRCVDLNKAVGGSITSSHVRGEAIDMTLGSKERNKELYEWCKANLIFDQLINEYNYSWVHISFRVGENRNMAFSVG